MKSLVRLIAMVLFFSTTASVGQCINNSQYPWSPVILQNSGAQEYISNCTWTMEFAYLMNVAPNIGYIFTCNQNGSAKYITVTSVANEVIAHGISPLTVQNIPYSEIRVHYSEDETCGVETNCADTFVQAVLSCMPPTNLNATVLSSSSAELTWTAPQDTNNFEVYVVNMDNQNPQPDSILPIPVTGTSYTATNLTAGTLYQFAVRSVCEDETGPINISPYFYTPCDSFTSLNETFEQSYYTLPNCWQAIRRGDGLTGHASITANYAYPTTSGTTAVQFYADGSNLSNADLILVTPPLSNINENYRLRFAARGSQSLQVGTLDSNTLDAVFTPLQTITPTDVMAYYTVDFSNYVGSDTYIGIRLTGNGSYDPVFVDDVVWEQNPACPDIAAAEVTATGTNSATISFQNIPAAASYDISYAVSSTNDPNQGAIVNTTANPFEINSLEPNTTYNFWIRTRCGEEEVGYWSAATTATTNCAAVATFYEQFTGAYELPNCWRGIVRNQPASSYSGIYITNFSNTTEQNSAYLYQDYLIENLDVILVSPAVTNLNTGTNRVKFKAFGTGDVILGTISGSGDNAVFTALQTFDLNENVQTITYNFAASASTDANIAFKIAAEIAYSYIVLDDISYEAIPACPDVTGISASNVSTNQAQINFNEVSGAVAYEVVVTTANSPEGATPVTFETNSGIVTNLQANTAYKVFVRSSCGENQLGVWSEAFTFYTSCETVEGFIETFEAVITPQLPNCWTGIVSGPNVSPYSSIQTYYYGQNQANLQLVYLFGDGSTIDSNSIITLVSPRVSTLNSGQYRVRFSAFGNATLVVGTLSSNNADATFTPVQTFQFTEYNNYTYSVVFDTPTTDEYIGFKLEGGDIYNYVALDDIYYEPIPACDDIYNVSIVDFDDDDISLAWEGNNNDGGVVVYSTVPNTDPNLLSTYYPTSENSIELENLEPLTVYYIWIKSTCAAGSGVWIGPIIANTDCATSNIEEISEEGFDYENGAMPYCWSAAVYEGDTQWQMYEPTGDGSIAEAYSGSTIAYKQPSASSAVLFAAPIDYTDITQATEVDVYLHRHENAHESDMYNVYVNTERSMDGAMLIGTIHSRNSIEPVVSASGFYNYKFDIPAQMNGMESVYVMIEGITVDSDTSEGLGVENFIVQFAETLNVDAPNFEGYVRVFPNPATTLLNVSASENIEAVKILNQLGQVVFEKKNTGNSAQIDVSQLATGAYFVQLFSNKANTTKKFIKQ